MRVGVDPCLGLRRYQVLALGKGIELAPLHLSRFVTMAQGLYEAFCDCDARLAEINPLATTAQGDLLALDGKIIVDDNALFRHAELVDLRDPDVETPAERRAREAGMNYVQLEGDIGCLVNGAGLAMATMDVIEHFGGAPANFLDIGGGAQAEAVAAALRLMLAAPGIRAALLNIFGGITRCDEVARGIVATLEDLDPDIPMVVRLVGTNEAEGRAILDGAAAQLGHSRVVERGGPEGCQRCTPAGPGVGGTMAILVDADTRLLVQGITGREGQFHSKQMLRYGTRVVAGVTPGKGGLHTCEGRVPVFDTVQEAVGATGPNVSIVYVPAPYAPDALYEAV